MTPLIHQRVLAARAGQNSTVIRRMPSGWLVLGDVQILRGYCVLLADPVVRDINALDPAARETFLHDMVLAGDALLQVTAARLINYQLLGNTDLALHAHIHPRYHAEPDHRRPFPPWEYHRDPPIPLDLGCDRELMDQIGRAIDKRLAQS
jgi:diadenosine tetraphosphate (Ap4A) HIT family hydrolase